MLDSNTHVLMVVNNPGSNDVRVVKQAELVVKNGGRCTVLGVLKPGFETEEVINGVSYRRVRISYTFIAMLAAYFPKLALRLVPTVKWGNSAGRPDGQLRIKNNKTLIGKIKFGFSKISRVIFNPVRSLIVRTVFKYDFLQSFSVKLRQGAYLQGFYPYILSSEADIVQSHELGPLESCVLGARGRNVIYDSHELERHRNSLLGKSAKRAIIRYEEKYIHSVSSVFAVSPGCAKEIKEQYQLPSVGVIRNCPALYMQAESKVSLRETLGLKQSAPLVLYTGSLTFNRGLESVIEALADLEGFHLACVGPANVSILKGLESQAQSLGVGDRFHHVDRVEPGILISYVSDADLAVVPIQDACLSYHYCLPNKLFEAIHANIPVLASNLPDIREIIDRESVGEVFNWNEKASIPELISLIFSRRNDYYSAEKSKSLKGLYSFEREFDSMLSAYRATKC